MNWLTGLSLPEFIAVLVVGLEVFIVVFALTCLAVVRRGAIRREEKYDNARRRLSELIPDLDGPRAQEADRKARELIKSLGLDNARRLLTELAEFMTVEGATPLAAIFIATGLAESASKLATRKPWERLRAIREARALNDPSDMLSTLVKDLRPDVRISAFEALCALGRSEEGLVSLRQITTDGRLVRTRAIDALAAATPADQP